MFPLKRGNTDAGAVSPSLASCSLPSAWPGRRGRQVASNPAMFYAVCDFASPTGRALCRPRQVERAVSSSEASIGGVSDPLTAMNRCALSSAFWLAKPHANGSSRRLRASVTPHLR